MRGKRILVVDDAVNTGESVRETCDAVRGAGGEVITVAALPGGDESAPWAYRTLTGTPSRHS